MTRKTIRPSDASGVPTILLSAALCGALPANYAIAQSPPSYWESQQPPAQQPYQNYWSGDTRPFDGSPRGTFAAPSRMQAPPPPQLDYAYQQPSAPNAWKGLYAGAHIGGTIGDVATIEDEKETTDLSNWMAGGYVGLDIALGNIVIGVEADATWSLNEGDDTAFGTYNITPNLDWLATVRGRVGYAWNQFMFYGTAGFAFTQITYDFGLDGLRLDEEQTQTGFVVGGGVDIGLSSSLSLRIEALHYGFGENDFKLGDRDFKADTDLTTIRTGLTFRF